MLTFLMHAVFILAKKYHLYWKKKALNIAINTTYPQKRLDIYWKRE